MTPEEKARQLIEKYANYNWSNPIELMKERTKQCAIITVDEIEKALTEYGEANNELQNMDRTFNYWQEVRKEIEKL